MDLCSGGELFNQLVKLTFLSEDLARHVIQQVAEAVLYLHQTRGIVHRFVISPILYRILRIMNERSNYCAETSNLKISFLILYP